MSEPYDHAAAIADLRRRHARAKQYADEAHAAGDTVKLHKALRLYYQRAIQIDHAESAPDGWECPQCVWGEEDWPRFDMLLRQVYNCVPHYEDIAREKAAAMLAAQVEAL